MTNEGVKRMKIYNSRIALRLSDREREKAGQLIRERIQVQEPQPSSQNSHNRTSQKV